MNSNRFVCLSGVILCLLVGGYLRLKGVDWGAGNPRDGSGAYSHPDERSVYDKAARIRWDTIPREPEESWFQYQKKAFSKWFLDWNSGLNLKSFNYGSFPYYLLVGLTHLANTYTVSDARWWLLDVYLLLLIFLALRLALRILRLRSSISRGEPRTVVPISSPWLHFLVPALGWGMAAGVTALFAGRIFRVEGNPLWGMENWGILARPISGIAGTLTLFYVYRIGARVYDRRIGLLAAILLTFTVLHIQLSHYYTFDVLLAFFCTAAVYSMLVFIDAGRWCRRWFPLVSASVWTGLAMATKFGGILLFIPWGFSFLVVFWRHRPRTRFFGLRTALFSGSVALAAWVSFSLIWGTAFLTQPFGYLDPTTGGKTRISFVHVNFQAGPKVLPESVRDRLDLWGGRLNPWTAPLGFHFTPLNRPGTENPFPHWLTIGGGKYWRDIDEQRRMALEGGVPWTRQYRNTIPFVYQWKNLVYYGMGIPLGLLCLFGLAVGFGAPFYRPTWGQWLIWFWMVPNFVPTHLFHAKFPRYLAPQLPFFCLWGAVLATAVFAWCRKREGEKKSGSIRWDWIAAGSMLIVVVWSGLYSRAFLEVFTGKHPWSECSEWFEKEVPEGSKLISEQWDDPVPWDGRVRGRYRTDSTNPIHSGSENHIRGIARKLEWADYYCFSSKRNYGAFLQAEGNSDNRVRFYKSLFAGNLGFRLIKTFSRPVYVLGIPIRFELADESLSLYDHPTVHIFKKVERLSRDEITDRILHPPRWVLDLSKEQILTAQEDRSVLAPRVLYPVPVWWLGMLVLGWVAWPVAFVLFRGCLDGGLSASKSLGLLLLTYVTWFGASVGWWPAHRGTLFGGFVGLTVVSAFCIRLFGKQMARFLREKWILAVGEEVFFLLVFAFFLFIRMNNPDIHWGEKPMDASFVSAAYKTESFPAQDPWFAGKPINYYCYGQTVVGLFGKWVGVPPEYAYNLAVGTWPSLVFLLIAGIVFNLTGSRFGALVGGFLGTMAGNGKALLQLAANLRVEGGPIDPRIFRESYVPHDGLTGYLFDVWEQLRLALGLVPPLFSQKIFPALDAWISGFDPEKVKVAQEQQLPHLIGFDAYFWKLSRICKSSVACEFPAWSATFADLHAHLLVMPFGMLFVALTVAFCQRKNRLWKLRSSGRMNCAREETGGLGTTVAQVLALGFLMGTVTVTNTWDLPGWFGFFFAAVCILFLFSLRSWGGSSRWGLGRAIVRMGIWGGRLRRWTWIKFGVFQEILVPALAVFLLSRALFFPFHRAFHTPERVRGVRWMHDAACGWTTPYEFVQIFGPFLPILILGIWVLHWRWAADNRWGTFKSVASWLVAWIMSVGAVRFMRSLAAKVYARPPEGGLPKKDSLEFWRFLDADTAYVVGGFAFFLFLIVFAWGIRKRGNLKDRLGALILLLGLAIVTGCEVVYVEEGWAPPLHRWNTLFKLHLQAWLCLSIGCGWLIGKWLSRAPVLPPVSIRLIARAGRYALGYPVLVASLLAAGVFPMLAPFLFSHADGFRGRTRQIPGETTVDGLHYLRVRYPDVAAAIDWLRSKVPADTVVLEAAGEAYHHETSRFSTHSGLPTLIGWPHHSRERGNLPEPRIRECRTIYTSTNRRKVRDLLRLREVRYVIVGPTERSRYGASGGKGLRKFDEWNDLFYVAFRSRNVPPGVTIYGVHPNYELREDWTAPEQEKVSGFRVEDRGLSLFDGRRGFGPGEYAEARGIAVNAGGEVFVTDTHNHRIQAYRSDGRFQWYLGERGEEIGFFKEPSDVAVDDEGNLYVLDTWNSRVQVFDPEGLFKTVMTGFGGGARGLYVGRIPIAEKKGNVWKVVSEDPPRTDLRVVVANTSGKNVTLFDKEGRKLGVWGIGAGEARLEEPVDVEVTPFGLAVADSKRPRIVFFDGVGRYLMTWDLPFPPTGNYTNEIHLAWDSKRRVLFVTDPEHDKVWALEADGRVAFETVVEGKPTGVEVTPGGKVYVSSRERNRVVSLKMVELDSRSKPGPEDRDPKDRPALR